MASYGTKYTFSWDDAAGTSCEVRLQKAGYSSSATALTPSKQPFEATWGQQGQVDMTQPLLISTARLRFMGSSTAASVEEVFDSPDRQWRVQYLEGGSLEWQGFLAMDLWKDNPNTRDDVIELEAIDGLALTETQNAFFNDDGVHDTLSDILRATLRDLHDLPIWTSMDWHAHNAEIGSGQCPLDVYEIPETAHKTLDDGSVESPIGRRAQLEDIAERFGLQIFQAGGAWHLRQRDQVDDGTQLKRWKMGVSELSFGASPTTDDITASLPFQSARTEKPRSRVARLRSVKSTYSYKDLGELIKNGSFENGSAGWTLQGDSSVKDFSDTDISATETQSDSSLLRVDPIDPTKSADNRDDSLNTTAKQYAPALLHDAGPQASLRVQWDMAAVAGAENRTNIALDDTYYIQARELTVKADTQATEDEGEIPLKNAIPGTDGTRVIPQGQRLHMIPPGEDIPPSDYKKKIRVEEPAEAGDDVLIGSLDESIQKDATIVYWVWSDTEQVVNEGTTQERRYFGLFDAYTEYPAVPTGQDVFIPQEIRVPFHTPSGKNLAGKELSVAFGVRGGSTDQMYVDHVSALHTKGGDKIEATTYISTDEDQFGRRREITHRVGAGPTASHPRRVFDPVGGTDLLTGWKPAPYASGESSTGKGLEQLTAEQWMRQRRDTLDRRTFQFEARGQEIGPQHVYQLGGTAYTPTFVRYVSSSYGNTGTIELTEAKDAGLSGLTQVFTMESDTSSTGGAGGSGGTTIVSDQTIEGVSSWDELSGTLSGNIPFDESGPTELGADFSNVNPNIQWTRDPANSIALKVRDTSNSTDLFGVTDAGQASAPTVKAEDTLLVPVSGGSATDDPASVTSNLSIWEGGSKLVDSATDLIFDGDAVSTSVSADEVTVTIDAGGTDFQAGDLLSFDTSTDPDTLNVTGSFYTDADAVSAVNNETSLSVDISGDADTLDGVDLANISFSDIAATRYTDSEARSALQAGTAYIELDNQEMDDAFGKNANLVETRREGVLPFQCQSSSEVASFKAFFSSGRSS